MCQMTCGSMAWQTAVNTSTGLAAEPTFPGGLGHPESSVLLCWETGVLGTNGTLSNPSVTSTLQAGTRQTGEGTKDCGNESDPFYEENTHSPRTAEGDSPPPT